MSHASFTAAEVVALFDLDEKAIRREIELGALPERKPVEFSFGEAVYLVVMRMLGVQLGVEDRRKVRDLVVRALSSGRKSRVELSEVLELKVAPAYEEVSTKGDRFDAWKRARIVEDDTILAGEPIFKGTRLPVRKIGAMIERHGERAVKELRADYPNLRLSEEDIELAPKYVRAYPRRGRPRETSPR